MYQETECGRVVEGAQEDCSPERGVYEAGIKARVGYIAIPRSRAMAESTAEVPDEGATSSLPYWGRRGCEGWRGPGASSWLCGWRDC